MNRPIDVYRHAAAPIEVVWDLLQDHLRYPDWTTVPKAELERVGDDNPNGVGAIRRLGIGSIVAREQVVLYEPPLRLSYVVLSGLPVRGYRADVVLNATSDGGTDIRWTGAFESAPFGLSGLMRRFLERILRDFATALVREAERRSTPVS